jgi:hypothetical protein
MAERVRRALLGVGGACGVVAVCVAAVLVAPVLVPVALAAWAISLSRLRRLRPFDSFHEDACDLQVVFLSSPRDGPFDVLVVQRSVFWNKRICHMRFEQHRSVCELVAPALAPIRVACAARSRRVGLAELLGWEAELHELLGWEDAGVVITSHFVREARRALAHLRWRLERPARVVQRAWRAHRRRRRGRAVAIIERAALHALYRPGGWRARALEASFSAASAASAFAEAPFSM